MFKAWTILMLLIPMVGCSMMRDLWREFEPEPEPEEPDGPAHPSNIFLWKPESDVYTGHGFILLPYSLRGEVDRVEVWNGGRRIETADRHYSQDPFANGGREHYKLDDVGGHYGDDVTVKAIGVGVEWQVPNGGERYEVN